MTKVMSKEATELNRLQSILLSSLDESLFFTELVNYIKNEVGCDSVSAYKVMFDQTLRQVCKKGKAVSSDEVIKFGEGLAGHVVKTKKSYFCNDVSRDPLLAKMKNKKVLKEMAVPVIHQDIVIGSVHLQVSKSEKDFSKDDILLVNSILEDLKAPIANMKIFMQAKMLNESLMREIQKKERELNQQSIMESPGMAFKVSEKPIVGKSKEMGRAVHMGDRVAESEVNVIITGEKGTGKDLIAGRIHCRSKRKSSNFINIDVSIMGEKTVEAELFGEEKVIDGKMQIKKGAFEICHNGTLCLNNVHELPIATQQKVQKVLDEGKAMRLGSECKYNSKVRIVSTTTKDLAELVSEGKFREDLYYILGKFQIDVPALRERGEDVEILAYYFLDELKSNGTVKSLSPGAVKAIMAHNWPGNVRELRNVMERAYILSDGMIIEKSHLSEGVLETKKEVTQEESDALSFQEMTLDELEKKHITMTLGHLGGNKTKTAKTLGITVKTLYNKLHSYGMIHTKEA